MNPLHPLCWILVGSSVAFGQAQPAPASRNTQAIASVAVAPLTQPFTGDLDGMVKRRLIRVLTPYSRTGFFIDKGTPRGMVYDLIREFETDLNLKRKTGNLRVHVVAIPTPAGKLVENLLAGQGDIVVNSALITEQRLQQVDFANPTRSNVSELIVTGPGGPEIGSLNDLSGKSLYVSKSWAYWKDMEELSAKFVKEGRAPLKLMQASELLSMEDQLEMVNAGIVPATATHDFLAAFWAQILPKLKVNQAAVIKAGGQVAPAIRKGSPQLKAELNAFLAKYADGSARRNMLFATYLKNTKFAKEATSPADQAKLENLVALFQKYGDKYGLDYLLMAAQGYQESTLNHTARSPVGAVGVMQVMPATGKDLNVGDITQLEPNIHAGVKFIRFMMDKYYGQELAMSQLNKGLFTFAAYNAGPARIAQLRKLAAARGLDPNVWFNNVEIIASEKIGRETVTYVSNIYKYYVGYKLLLEQKQEQQRIKDAARKVAGPN